MWISKIRMFELVEALANVERKRMLALRYPEYSELIMRMKTLDDVMEIIRRTRVEIDKIVSKVRKSRVSPPTWGQEIETDEDAVNPDFLEFTREYLNGEFDGSGL